MIIRIVKDSDFTAIPEYNADDISTALEEDGIEHSFLSHSELASLKRSDCDCLVLPYLTGNFTDAPFSNMMSLHRQGMSLCVFGDVPHIDKWFPIRNMLSFEMHLTRYQEHVRLNGLTEKGREILGELKDFEQFCDHDICALRITGFPEDITHNLIDCQMNDWHFPPVVAIERKSEQYLAAKYAQFGFTGGEPREVALGVYPMEWTYDIGPLNRQWSGMNNVTRKLIAWCQPSVNAAIQYTAVHKEHEANPLHIQIRNPCTKEHVVSNMRLALDGETIFTQEQLCLAPGAEEIINITLDARSAGLHDFVLTADINGQNLVLHERTEHVVSDGASTNPIGFGASSHYGYKDDHQSSEAKHFLRQLKQRGCQYFRMNVAWEEIEPEPGQYNWGICDDMLAFAEEEHICMSFWMFPTTRGCGLGDAGVPAWTLQEAAIDRDGNPGNFPSIWSPFYRNHYFNMIEAMCRRYADHPRLDRFILDFGNSDFPYGYYYYVNDNSLFDYSPYEREAFAKYLRDQRGLNLDDINTLYDASFTAMEEVPVPYVEDSNPWSYYLDFRTWSLHQGMEHIQNIIRKHAPKKLPPDVPGHGLGSIANLGSNWYDVKKRHINEERCYQQHLTALHCAGEIWGGEAWQVGGSFKELDDALFGSLRFNASYNTVPGPDLNVYGEDLARIGYIRRSIMGAERRHPQIAVMGREAWNTWNSYTQVSSRLDQSADYLHSSHRFDFSCYTLLVLPTTDYANTSVTGGGSGMFLPDDESYYWLLRQSVERGLTILISPETCVVGRDPIQRTFLRQVCELEDINYGDIKERCIQFPDAFGGGSLSGKCRSIIAQDDDEILLRDNDGEAVLIRRAFADGAYLLAGWDDVDLSIDDFNYMENADLNGHSLCKIVTYMQIEMRDVRSEQSCVYKDKLSFGDLEFFVAYNHAVESKYQRISVRLNKACERAVDLATGEAFALTDEGDNWHSFNLSMHERKARYLQFGI